MLKLQSRLGEECAYFQAQLAYRAAQAGDFDHAAAIVNRVYDTVERTPHPHMSLARVIKRLGRERARVLCCEKRTIDDAIRNWQRYKAVWA